MTNDISLNGHKVIDSNGTGLLQETRFYTEWIPIGDQGFLRNGDTFNGNFDGQGHTISGLVRFTKNERCGQGLFGHTENAYIKNIKMVDCFIGDEDPEVWSNFGLICGIADNTTFTNCTVSQSAITIHENECNCVGGLVGGTNSAKKNIISNCSFDGNITFIADDYFELETSAFYIGGIIGISSYNSVVKNCTANGNIKIQNDHGINKIEYWVGGIAGTTARDGYVSGCQCSMNIEILSPEHLLDRASVCGISCGRYMTVNNCAYLGEIYIGEGFHKARIGQLDVFGIGEGKVNGSAFYGYFCVLCKDCKETNIAGITKNNAIGNDYKQNVVYSDDNLVRFETKPRIMNIDRVCCTVEDGKNHRDYYYLSIVDYSSLLDCAHSENKELYSKTLNELKADGFIKTLNTNAGSSLWGKLTGVSNERLNGLPMPLACGGEVTELTGSGTANDPYLIGYEAELRVLQEIIANGTHTTEGRYYKLANDIYMSSNLMPAIGSRDYPFKGTFDGGGHAIVGMVAEKGCLFDYLAGTLRNLALVDFNAAEGIDEATPLARTIGGKYEEAGTGSSVEHVGTIENCYVSGDLKITPKESSKYYNGIICGICGTVYDKGKVNNCYFKGSLEVAKAIDLTKTTYVFGGTGWVFGEVSNCYASYTLNNNDMVVRYDGFSSTSSNSTGLHTITNCYYVRTDQSNTTNGEYLASESELNAKFSEVSGWSQGLYRPVLTSVKSYAATFPDNSETKYLDAVPEPTPTSNYIVNITAGSDPYADKLVWQLPNTAVYVPSENTDYILNCTLDPSADFKYNPTSGTTATKGQLRYDLKQTEKGYHMVCLPGIVERDDLPEGAKVMIVGKIQTVDNTEQVNVVMVDTIPAGVPCMLYVPTTTVTTGTTIPLVMRSGIVSQPTEDANYSNMKGTFSATTATDACVTAKYSNGETLPVFEKTSGSTSVQPFTAWLAGATGANVQIVDYVLLDEENEAMTVTLADLNSKETNLKMRRALKTGQWNTICLPYSLTSNEILTLFGSGTKVEAFSGLEYNSDTNTYTLKFTAATEMTAGTPYLIKPSTADADNIFDIKDKMITCTSETYVPTGKSQNVTTSLGTTSLTMQGEYNHRMITPNEATNGKSLYVISGDKIYYVNSDVEMKGFRCYFVAEDAAGTSGTSMFSNARVQHYDGSTTDLRLIKAESTGDADAVYDLLGRKCVEQTKGVVIENGKKRIIK